MFQLQVQNYNLHNKYNQQMNVLQNKENLVKGYVDSQEVWTQNNLKNILPSSDEICNLCEKIIKHEFSMIKCCQQKCRKMFHKECVFQYMTIKHIFQIPPTEDRPDEPHFQFLCENCVIGTSKKCSHCLQSST